MDYETKVAMRYGKDWKDRPDSKIRTELKRRMEEKTKEARNWANRVEREKKLGYSLKQMKEATDGFDKAHSELEEIKTKLTSGDAFTNQSIQYCNYLDVEKEYSIANACGRIPIDKSRVGFTCDKYHDTECADIVPEGTAGTERSLLDYVDYVKTEAEENIKFEDILGISESVYDDDKETLEIALDSIHESHLINAENKEILRLIVESKEAVPMDPGAPTMLINSNLCGKAKRNCEIWTNSSGFTLLDTVGADGYPAITRDSEGNFVLAKKYIIREFSDEILPNTDNGAPVLIGDWKNIVRFAVVGATTLSMTDIYRCVVKDRNISHEIPILTTTSDKAYVNGYLVLD